MKISPITADIKDRFQIGADQKGVVITDVTEGGVAADRGLKPGDVIVEVQQAEVASPDDVMKKVEAQRAQDRKSVLMLIQGQDGVRYVPLPLTKNQPARTTQDRADRGPAEARSAADHDGERAGRVTLREQ